MSIRAGIQKQIDDQIKEFGEPRELKIRHFLPVTDEQKKACQEHRGSWDFNPKEIQVCEYETGDMQFIIQVLKSNPSIHSLDIHHCTQSSQEYGKLSEYLLSERAINSIAFVSVRPEMSGFQDMLQRKRFLVNVSTHDKDFVNENPYVQKCQLTVDLLYNMDLPKFIPPLTSGNFTHFICKHTAFGRGELEGLYYAINKTPALEAVEIPGLAPDQQEALQTVLNNPARLKMVEDYKRSFIAESPTNQLYVLKHNITCIAKHHDVSEEALAASLELFNLEGIERALQAAKTPRDAKDDEERALKSAHQEFVNHVLIPHLDYFVITAVKAAGNAASVDLRDYPNIQRVVGADYDFASLAKRSTQRVTGAANFDYLRDPTQGDHMERLQRALNEVNGVVSGYEGMFRTLEADIAQIYTDIDKNRGLIDEKGRYLVEARKGNEFRTDRIHEYTTRANTLLASAKARNEERAKVTVGRFLLHAPAEMFENFTGIPVRTMIGLPDLGNEISTARSTMAAAQQESDAARAVVEYYRSKQIDTDAIEGDIAIAKKGIEKLESNRDLKRLQQDDAKKKAVAEAFVNKLMLSFGKRMSGALQDICEDHGIEHIDDVFGAFEADPRFKEALENLCFGIADSNDLSVIMAEVASFNNESPAHTVLQEFVEGTLKANIDSLYAHASKVDLIYQANLSRLGTGLHDARHMIRSAYDERVTSLFSDSFGVHSELSDFSVLGATDVKNLFDYYLHRHGKDTLTDTKIHDGKVTGQKAPKRLSVLGDQEVSEHVELAKNYRSYRQQGPDITDMFLRTCGYEYFYPQAPNGAPRTNIMTDNPEAPAAYVMANKVLHSFIQKMTMQGIDDYRGKVGEKLDALISESLMDFFSELGRIHAADHKLGEKRGNLKQAAKETGTFGFAFDSYERVITRDALSRFDLFLEIYSANLQKQVRDCPKDVASVLRKQVAAIREVNGDMLNPQIVEPGSHEDRHRARVANHSFENTYWRGAS